MFCENCGSVIEDNSEFCMECGFSIISENQAPIIPEKQAAVVKKNNTANVWKILLCIFIFPVALTLFVLATSGFSPYELETKKVSDTVSEETSKKTDDTHDTDSEPINDAPKFEYYDASSCYKNCSSSDAFDNNKRTSWQDGVDGYGIGEWLLAYSFSKQQVSSIIIRNGYQCPQNNANLFNKNSRVKQITVIHDEGKQTFTLRDTRGDQKLTFTKPVNTESIKIVIDSVYEGDNYDDTCITDILFV